MDWSTRINEYIFSKWGRSKEARQKLQEILNISMSSVYKKTNGKVPYTLSEVMILGEYFPISQILFPSDVTMHLPIMNKEISHYSHYIEDFARQLYAIRRSSDQTKKLYYATEEVSFFHYVRYMPLLAFKFFNYVNFSWKKESPVIEKFDIYEVVNNYIDISEIADLKISLDELPMVEIWSFNILDSTLKQMEYYLLARRFSNHDEIFILLTELGKLIDDLEEKAKNGVHGPDMASYQLYVNELQHTNNIGIARYDDKSVIYFTYDNPNFAVSFDSILVDYTEQWMAKILEQSTMVSGSNLRQREAYFDRMRKRVAFYEERFKNIISSYLSMSSNLEDLI